MKTFEALSPRLVLKRYIIKNEKQELFSISDYQGKFVDFADINTLSMHPSRI